jgi:gluconate 2-dehydrogenase gamma chain
MPDGPVPTVSRRELLRGMGLAGTAILVPSLPTTKPATGAPPGAVGDEVAPPSRPGQTPPTARLEALTVEEAEILEAVMARLVPSDENGPGAVEAGALTYVDRALAGFLARYRETYRSNLLALDRYARITRGARFGDLSASDQDAVLRQVEDGSAAAASEAGFDGASEAFFTLLLNHTREGVFGDPYYGGNTSFIGWELLGYPGLRTAFTAADQELLEAGQLPSVRRSAYDPQSY